MRLTDHTDYSLRVLMYLNQTKRLVTLNELSEALAVPRNSLIKVSNQLARLGYIETSRGRMGGLLIHKDTGRLTLKTIILETEETFTIAECFTKKNCKCHFVKMCLLEKRLHSALEAFLNSLGETRLDEVTPQCSQTQMQLDR